MSYEPRDVIGLLHRSHDDLAQAVSAMSVATLEGPSGCSQWTIAQVLSHMGSAAEIGRNTLIAGKADMDGANLIWDRWNAMSAEEQAASFLESDASLLAAYDALSDDDLVDRLIDVGFLPAPVNIGFLLGMRASEVALHRWDIEMPANEKATVTSYLVDPVLQRQPVFAGFFARPIGAAGRVVFSLTDPDAEYALDYADEGSSLSESVGATGGTQVQMPAEAFVRLIGGRLGPAHTPSNVEVNGELTLDGLRRIFPGY